MLEGPPAVTASLQSILTNNCFLFVLYFPSTIHVQGNPKFLPSETEFSLTQAPPLQNCTTDPHLQEGNLKRCSNFPRETLRGNISAKSSTPHPDKSKGMKLIWMRFCLFKRGRKSLEVFSVQRRVFCRKGDDFFLFWSTRNGKKIINILEGS